MTKEELRDKIDLAKELGGVEMFGIDTCLAESLLSEIDRLNRIMPHTGETCKRFKIYGNEKIYGYCDHPTGELSSGEGIALRCVINTECENEAWELKD